MSATRTDALDRFVDGLVAEGTFTGLTAAVAGAKGELLWRRSAGSERPGRSAPRAATRGGVHAARWSTRWDLASLSKVHVATLALTLEASGELPLASRVGDVFPLASARVARLELEALLRHRSGFQAWAPLYALTRDRVGALDLLLSGTLLRATRRGLYSDLGYILWAFCAEAAAGLSLERLLRDRVWNPLGMRSTGPPQGPAGAAQSPLNGRREHDLAAGLGIEIRTPNAPRPGQVQDSNARFLGGLAGHAGVFSNARDMVALATEWLRPSRILRPRDIARALAGGGEYGVGWAHRRTRGSAGPALSKSSYGMVGFTGPSLWIDPESGHAYLLLGHRAIWEDLKSIRRKFHRLAVSAIRKLP